MNSSQTTTRPAVSLSRRSTPALLLPHLAPSSWSIRPLFPKAQGRLAHHLNSSWATWVEYLGFRLS